MKKLLILVLALACVFSMASCGEKTAHELYSNAVKMLKEAEGVEFEMKTSFDMTLGTNTQSSSVTYAAKQNGNNFSFEVKDAEIIPFESMAYVDGVFYLNANGKKIKETLNMDELLEEFKDLIPETEDTFDLPELTEEDLKDIEFTVENGIRSFSVKLDKSDIKDLLGSLTEGMDLGEASTVDAELSVSFDKKGNLNGFKFDIKMGITAPVVGEMSCEMEIEVNFKDFGKAPTITAPADAADYVEEK